MEIDFKRQGGVTTVPLHSAEDVALLPVVRPRGGLAGGVRRSGGRPLPARGPRCEPGVGAGVVGGGGADGSGGPGGGGELAPRHADFPGPVGGTDVHPQFDWSAVVAWLLAHDKIEAPVAMPAASLVVVVVGAGGGTSCFRLDGPWLDLADDAAGQTSCPAGLRMRTPTSWPP
ncbi:hypothetical protein ACIO7M_31755 [Streptomyces toxytricini]|uniref:Uncharacterized protein n=1 Tax=Streptomyces toxytricini TaxID=67369 RepID=A0ABW8EUU4_STRT5